jgi:hypothetical protein
LGLVLGQGSQREGTLETMSRGELEVERLRLIDSRPSVVPGIVVASVGTGVLILGVVLMSATIEEVLVAGALLILGGFAAITTGIIMAVVSGVRAGVISGRIRRVERRIEQLIQLEGLQPAQDGAVPPPPPPPGVWRDLPRPPQVLVATF